jgi:hypothetical protein
VWGMIKQVAKAVGIMVAVETVTLLILGLIFRWNDISQFGNAFSIAGYINMVLGFMSIIGNINNRFDVRYLSVSQRLGRNKIDLMKDEQDSTFKSFRFLIIMFASGLINILISSLF